MKRTKPIFTIEIVLLILGIIDFIANKINEDWDENFSFFKQPLFKSTWFWFLVVIFALVALLSYILEVKKEEQSKDSFKRYIKKLKQFGDNNDPLHFRNNFIPYVGREKEIEVMKKFINADAKLLWMGVVGAGGMGKSKFMRNFILNELKSCKGSWKAVWITGKDIEEILKFEDWKYPKNLLLVYDYAGVSCEKVSEWICKLEKSDSLKKKIRIVMLEREGAGEKDNIAITSYGWYSRFCGSGDVKYCIDNHKFSHESVDENALLKLGGLNENEGASLIRSYISCKNRELPSAEKIHALYEKSKAIDSKYDSPRPLYILLTVDSWLENKDNKEWNIKNLVEHVLTRYEKHWKKVVCSGNEELYKALIHLLTYTTACGAWSLIEDFEDKELSQARNTLESSKRAAEIITAINMQDKISNVLQPLEPDMIGELFVLREFKKLNANEPEKLKKLLVACWDKSDAFVAFLVRCRQNYGSLDTFNDVFALDKHFFEVWKDELDAGKVSMPEEVYFEYCRFVFAYSWMEPCDTENAVNILKYFVDTVKSDEIKLEYAQGLFNLTFEQDEAGRRESVGKLSELSEEEGRCQDEIKLEYAKGLFNLTFEQDEAGRRESVGKLSELSEEKGRCKDEIKLEYASGLVNLTTKQDEAGRRESVGKLSELSEEESRCQDEIKLAYASGLVNLTTKQDEAGRRESVGKLSELSEEEGRCQDEIKLAYAKGLFNLICGQDEAGIVVSVEKLRKLSEEKGKCKDEIKLIYARGLTVLVADRFENNKYIDYSTLDLIRQLTEEESSCRDEIISWYGEIKEYIGI